MQTSLVFIIWMACVALASAISCYDCDSMHDPRCNEYFSPEGVQQTECDDAEMPYYLEKYRRRIPATGCMTKIQEGVDGMRYFIRRTCYYGDLEHTEEACDAEDLFLPYTSILDCIVCSEDLCNTNNSHKIMPFGAYLALALSAVTCNIQRMY